MREGREEKGREGLLRSGGEVQSLSFLWFSCRRFGCDSGGALKSWVDERGQ